VTAARARPAVLFVSVPTGVGGSTRSLATVLGSLDGDAARVLAGPPAGRFVGLVADQGSAELSLPIVDHRRSWRPLRRAWAALRLAWWVWRHRRRLRAIHANGLKELSLSILAALVGRVRLVVWVHNFLLPPSVELFGPLWRVLLRFCDVRWAAVSPLAADLAAGAGLVSREDVEIVPNPIDPADVVATDRGPHDRVTAAYLGAPRAYKGFADLPGIVEATDPAAVRWLVFSHPTDDDLAATWDCLRGLEADGRLEIRGKLTDVRQAYAECDIVVAPSVRESFCRVAAEAMLNGLPVVGTDLEPVRDLLGEDEAGLVVPVHDPPAAGAAVMRLAADPALRSRLGAAGRDRAARFAPAAVRDRLAALYGLSRRESPGARHPGGGPTPG
jgi:glycosyltransferase involved in cell wall biosynthesis